ncbi:MAG: hypothetical protein ACK4K1_02460 [Flavobacterium sp.]
MWKKIAIVAGILALIGGSSYTIVKAGYLKEILEKMKIKVRWIRNIKIHLTNISFDLDIELLNNSPHDLDVTGAGLVKLTKLRMFHNKAYLGESPINLTSISIPNRNSVILKNVPFTVSTKEIMNNIITVSTINPNNVTIEATISALGTEFTINQ